MKIEIEATKTDAKAVLAKYEAMTKEQLIGQMREKSPGMCDTEIYTDGRAASPITALNMYATEFLCDLLREMTGARLDWCYCGGRSEFLLHPKDENLRPAVLAAVELVGITSENYPKGTFYARVHEIKRSEIVAD